MSPAGVAGPTNWVDLVVRAANAMCIDLAAGERGPGTRVPEFKARAIEAGKLKRFAEKHECTLDDLGLALDYVVEHKIDLKSPAGLVFFVGVARKRAFLAARGRGPLLEGPGSAGDMTTFEWAVHREAEKARDGDDRAQYWLRRFQRASGHARKDVLDEWAVERGGVHG